LKGDNKIKYCYDFKYYLSLDRIIPNEYITVNELAGFGRSSKSKKQFRGQLGNDDAAMTCINLSSLFEAPQYTEMAYYMLEKYNDDAYISRVYNEIIEKETDSNLNYENARVLRNVNNEINDEYDPQDIMYKYLK
jgi:hypothetical protein